MKKYWFYGRQYLHKDNGCICQIYSRAFVAYLTLNQSCLDICFSVVFRTIFVIVQLLIATLIRFCVYLLAKNSIVSQDFLHSRKFVLPRDVVKVQGETKIGQRLSLEEIQC